MIRALLWKEWRQQRSLVIAALVLAAILPLFLAAGAMASRGVAPMHELTSALLPLYALTVWPLFAAATGGTTLAADMGDGSLGFLLSRPVSRARVWLLKVGVALSAFAIIVIGTTMLAISFAWLTATDGRAFRNTLSRVLGNAEIEALFFLGLYLFLSGCAVYCSVFVKRPLLAAVGGLLVAGGLAGAVGLVWSALVPRSPLGQTMLAAGASAGIPVATIGVFGAALRAFSRGAMFGGSAGNLFWRPLPAIAVVAMLAGSAPAVFLGKREVASMAASQLGGLQVVDDHVVVPELNERSFTTRLVLRSLLAGPPSVVVGGPATNPTLSPNGEWLLFVDYSGVLSSVTSDPHLRALQLGTTDAHVISERLPDWSWRTYGSNSILVAPDNDHVAFAGFGSALVTSISGGPESSRELVLVEGSGAGSSVGGVIGWMEQGAPELLYQVGGPRFRRTPAAGGTAEWAGAMRKTELRALNPATGESRLVRAFAGSHRLQVWGSGPGPARTLPSRAWVRFPVWLDSDTGDDRLHLVDVSDPDGGMVELSPSACDIWGFSVTGEEFVYANCRGELRTGDAFVEFRLHNLESGASETFAVLDGYESASIAREVFLSPDGEQLLVFGRRGFGAPRGTHLVARNGVTRMLAQGFVPLGWRGANEVLLVGYDSRVPELRVVDVETGRERVVFP